MPNYSDQETVLNFANNVKSLRKAQKLSQERLAQLTDLDRSYISRIERVKCCVSIEVAKRIATALNVGIERLIN